MTEELAIKLGALPDSPGCYMMKSGGKIIYVGKAKNLKNRVRQYFHPSVNHTPKVRAMVEKVDDFDIVLVDSEMEAFALECNLIKLHMPHYNILLKDDKHYPYIRIDRREYFPRVTLARKQERDGARYFGPYQAGGTIREILDVARTLFPIRPCEYALNPKRSRKPCMYYQVGKCSAPCAGLITEEAYDEIIVQVMDYLSGKYAPVMEHLQNKMREFSAAMRYEQAALYRDKIRALESVMRKQQAISTSLDDRDVVACLECGLDCMIQLLIVRSGRLIGSEHFLLEGAAADGQGEVMTQFMLQYYSDGDAPPEILTSFLPNDADTLEDLLSEANGPRVHISRPMRGDKAKLTQMALKNARDAWDKQQKRERAGSLAEEGLEELTAELGLDAVPRRIEGYDISNTQGDLSVGSMVVMEDGKCVSREYRHFRVKTVEGANDFASIHEILTRRLSHGLKEIETRAAEGLPPEGGKFSRLPDLILIDGGRGQLSAALSAMREQGLNIPMFGLAERIDEIVLPYDDDSLLLDRHSPALRLIQRLRDEAHRFAVTRHRALRGRQSTASVLDSIAGVGEKRRRAILNHFKTVDALRHASADDIAQVQGVPKAVAEAVYKQLHTDENP